MTHDTALTVLFGGRHRLAAFLHYSREKISLIIVDKNSGICYDIRYGIIMPYKCQNRRDNSCLTGIKPSFCPVSRRIT